MITQTTPPAIVELASSTPLWKREFRSAVRDVDQLLDAVGLGSSPLAAKVDRKNPFAMRVPYPFIDRMVPQDPGDPLLLQVLPLREENASPPGFVNDPLQEREYNAAPGIIHKYHGRVLLITTPVCAVNCRYCFRRHFPYEENTLGKEQWLKSLDYIGRDHSISEVILSGGDPLATDDRHLTWLADRIEEIPHVRRLRIHSRLPVVIPSRINNECLNWLSRKRLKVSLVLHVNHGNEIDDSLTEAIAKVRSLGIPVLNQSVILRGINDNADILVELSEKLFDAGVLPYYLHMLDPVAGAGHFLVNKEQTLAIHKLMQTKLPGYLLPRLVADVPGMPSKMPAYAFSPL